MNNEEKIIITDNGINLKILSKELCCIYGDKNSSNYFIKKEYLEDLLKRNWE